MYAASSVGAATSGDSKYNRPVQACDLHTGATVHLWRATVHPRAAVHPWDHGTSKSPIPRYAQSATSRPSRGQSTLIEPRYTLLSKFSTAP